MIITVNSIIASDIFNKLLDILIQIFDICYTFLNFCCYCSLDLKSINFFNLLFVYNE